MVPAEKHIQKPELTVLSNNDGYLAFEAQGSIYRATTGRTLSWILTILGLGGLSLLSKAAWIALATTPFGWGLIASCLLAGGIGGYYRYKSKKRLALKEQQEQIISQLIENEKAYRKHISPDNIAINHLWRLTQKIDNSATRADLQYQLLYSAYPLDLQKNIESLAENHLSTPTLISTFSSNLSTYQALHLGKLTPIDKTSLRRSTIGAFFNWSTLAFGIGGFTLLKITGIAAFGAVFAAAPIPVAAIILSALLIGGIAAAHMWYVSSKRKNKIAEAQNKTKASQLLEANKIEFERINNLIKQKNNLDNLSIEKSWARIDDSDLNLPAKVKLQADFLKALLKVKNNPKLYESFKKNWLSPIAENNGFSELAQFTKKLQKKESQKNISKNIKNSPSNSVRAAIGRFFTALFTVISVPGLTFKNTSSLQQTVKSPTSIKTFIAGTIISVGYAIARFISIRKRNFQQVNEYLRSDLIANDIKYKQLQNNQSPTFSEKDIKLWKKINNIDDPAERCRLQKKFLFPKNKDNHSELFGIKINNAEKKNLLNSFDPTPIFNNLATYKALEDGELTLSDKASLLRSSTGAFFNWSTLISGAIGIATQKIDKTLGILMDVAGGLISSYFKYNGSRKKEKIQETQERAEQQLEYNKTEFKRIIDNLENNPSHTHTITNSIKDKWEMLDSAVLQPASKAKIQIDFLNHLLQFKNSKDKGAGEKAAEKLDKNCLNAIKTIIEKLEVNKKAAATTKIPFFSTQAGLLKKQAPNLSINEYSKQAPNLSNEQKPKIEKTDFTEILLKPATHFSAKRSNAPSYSRTISRSSYRMN